MNETECLEFFNAQAQAFTETLQRWQGRQDLVDNLLSQAFSSFDGNVAMQSQGCPELACHKGCATCCTLRVTATAPEILLVTRYIYWQESQGNPVNLAKRVVKSDQSTRGLNEAERVRLRRACPFVLRGVCTIYPVRPLACRGHACYDRQACVDAACGRRQEIPISGPHKQVRGLIQNAMQSSLRDAGYAWGCYELNQAVVLALQDPQHTTRWLAGFDVFAPAMIDDVSQDEMGQTYDQLKTGYELG